MLRVGIVGLPNVGKSTLFNAVTRTHKAEAANYPFCTIEPNVGCVEVPDERLGILARLVHTEKIVPASIEFVDIAGIVKDAYKGEGLGNQFLANIRETDAIIQVVRCFEDDDIVHTMGKVDPIRDIDVINTELLLADVQSVEKQVDTWAKKAKSNDKTAVATHRLLQRLYAYLNDGNPANTLPVDEEEERPVKEGDDGFQTMCGEEVAHPFEVPEDAGAKDEFAEEQQDEDQCFPAAGYRFFRHDESSPVEFA